MNEIKINILGTDYEVIKDNPDSNPKLKECDGYCEKYSKKIVVQDEFPKDNMTAEKLELYRRQILRHEIIHCFMYESGLDTSSIMGNSAELNEELTDWIAIQFSKLLKAFKEAEAL
ncbi:MAG: hypothetical protein PHD60_05685 [Clostridia bacterium]|nr:hypothetical protein [Clostridia bacterium]